MLLKRWGKGVKPVLATDVVLERGVWFDVLDPEWKDGDAIMDGALSLSHDVFRGVGIGRENENHYLSAIDSANVDLSLVHSSQDIPRRDPAPDAALLKLGADGVGGGLVDCGVTDNDVVSH
jgi:hypothetical protein